MKNQLFKYLIPFWNLFSFFSLALVTKFTQEDAEKLVSEFGVKTKGEIKKSHEDITKVIETKMADLSGKLEEIGSDKDAIKQAHADFKTEMMNILPKWEALQKHVDDLELKAQKGSARYEQELSLRQKIANKFHNDEIKQGIAGFAKGQSNGFQFEIKMDTKAVGTMTGADSLTGDVIDPMRLPGIAREPFRNQRVRDFIKVGGTVSDTIKWVQEVAGEGVIAPQTEGAAKSQLDIDFILKSASVETIAGFLRISLQMINDAAFMSSFISTRLVEKLKLVEDTQVLFGDGNTPNLNGIYTQATAFAAGAFADHFPTASPGTQIDVLLVAINQAIIAEYSPTTLLLNPTDFTKLLMLKDANQRYILDYIVSGGLPSLAGVNLVQSTAMTAGNFLVGDFMYGTQLFDRESVNVKFGYEDSDNFTKNLVTLRVEERVGLVVANTLAFVKGTFGTTASGAIDDITVDA